MAIAVTSTGTADTASGTTSLVLTFSASAAVGDIVFVVGAAGGSGSLSSSFTLVDSAGNTWTPISNISLGASDPGIRFWYSVLTSAITSGVSTATFDTTSTTGAKILLTAKITGLTVPTYFRHNGTGSATGTAVNFSIPTTGRTVPDAVQMVWILNSATSSWTPTDFGNFVNSDNNVSSLVMRLYERTVSDISSTSYTGTWGTSNEYGYGYAVFSNLTDPDGGAELILLGVG